MTNMVYAGILWLAAGFMPFIIMVGSARAQTTVQVSMQNIAFSPQNITVSEGTTVMWSNLDPFDHTVTGGTPGNLSGLFNSGIIGPGATYSRQFNSSGTFPYFCTIHPTMTGTVTVVRPARVSETVFTGIEPFILYQNVPNPFNSETMFSYDLKTAGTVTFTIYSITGQKIWERVEYAAVSGRHTLAWSAEDAPGAALSAGIYFYTLDHGGTVAVRRMLYAK